MTLGGSVAAAGGGDGPNVWYWAGGLSDTDFDGGTGGAYGHSSYCYGNNVVASQAGTVTKIATKFETDTGTVTLKMWLATTNNALLSSCTTNPTLTVAEGAVWKECTLTTPYAISANGTVRVFASVSQDAGVYMKIEAGTTGWYGTCAYADAPCNPPTSVGSESTGYSAKVYVD
jgi:hypothetical protein